MTKKRQIATTTLILVCLVSILALSACVASSPILSVTLADSYDVYDGDDLDVLRSYLTVKYVSSSYQISTVDDYYLYGELVEGECTIIVIYKGVRKPITVVVQKSNSIEVSITLAINKSLVNKNETATLTATVNPSMYQSEVKYRIVSGSSLAQLNGNTLTASGGGTVEAQAYVENSVSNIVSLYIIDANKDPYSKVSSTSFYNNYKIADSPLDAYWRSQHNLMSGSIANQNQEPTVASNQPKSGNKFIRNSDENYADNGNTWNVVDSNGNVVNKIYKGGAYVTLEEVAAYVYAFGDVPANYIESNSTSSLSGNAWGKYLRLNHNYFSGNTSSYPYEPALPRISGIGNGDLRYYEIDIGTTGTDCDPGYTAAHYNNGSKIVRGAARIVYSRYYRSGSSNGAHIDDLSARYVFYTYNHYNDFQEYLNYQGGWGEIFGNVTGGGTLSSKTNYNPTPYVEVLLQSLAQLGL